MQVNPGFAFWGVALITAGVVALAATLLAGLVAGGLAGTLVAGIPDGLSFGCGGEPTETATENGTFEDDAEVELDFNCGDLAVTTAPGAEWSVEARHGGDRDPEIASDGDSLRVSAEGGGFIPFTQEGRQEWEIVLPTKTTVDLAVDANASSSRLDLDGADLARLGIDANAGDVHVGLAGARGRRGRHHDRGRQRHLQPQPR